MVKHYNMCIVKVDTDVMGDRKAVWRLETGLDLGKAIELTIRALLRYGVHLLDLENQQRAGIGRFGTRYEAVVYGRTCSAGISPYETQTTSNVMQRSLSHLIMQSANVDKCMFEDDTSTVPGKNS